MISSANTGNSPVLKCKPFYKAKVESLARALDTAKNQHGPHGWRKNGSAKDNIEPRINSLMMQPSNVGNVTKTTGKFAKS